MLESLSIPQKSHFKLNEVCSITGVKPYVLRFWESEFEEISPILSSSGQKLYEHKDIEAVAFIKKLLFQDKLTVEQAKKELSQCLNTSVVSDSLIEDDVDSTSEVELVFSSAEESKSQNDSMTDSLRIEKVLAAKAKLQSMLEMAQSIQNRHNW